MLLLPDQLRLALVWVILLAVKLAGVEQPRAEKLLQPTTGVAVLVLVAGVVEDSEMLVAMGSLAVVHCGAALMVPPMGDQLETPQDWYCASSFTKLGDSVRHPAPYWYRPIKAPPSLVGTRLSGMRHQASISPAASGNPLALVTNTCPLDTAAVVGVVHSFSVPVSISRSLPIRPILL